jgi:2-isopropylmalate synthase
MDIKICDITLRDGEQAAGVNFYPDEKLAIAEKLVLLNVPIIEAGFAAASPSDFNAIDLISREIGLDSNAPIICSMARAKKHDIEVAAEALSQASNKRIQVVLSTSDIHLKYKFNIGRNEAREITQEMVEYAASFGCEVEFAAEDATRTDTDFLIDIFKIAVDAGASIVEIPDTVGYASPAEYGELVSSVCKALPDDIIISTHCHNDLGLAVANTLAGIASGAKQAEVTINGIGERAGNASLEEVVMNLDTRKDLYKIDTDIETKHLLSASQLVSHLSGMSIQKNKAIVGDNAFLHESGIHQHGMLKNKDTYQIMDPEKIGWAGNQMIIGKHSGKYALLSKLRSMDIELTDDEFVNFYEKFKRFASKNKIIEDGNIQEMAGHN